MSVAAPSSPVERDQPIFYAITVGNAGPEVAKDTVVRFRLPAGTTVQFVGGGTIDPATNTLILPIGTVSVGASYRYDVILRADVASPSIQAITEIISGGGGFDPVPANNQPVVSTVRVVDTVAPTLLRTTPIIARRKMTGLVLTFSEPLDPVGAIDARRYRVFSRAGQPIAVRSAVYDAASSSVTLTFARPLAARVAYRLRFRTLGDPSGNLVPPAGTA